MKELLTCPICQTQHKTLGSHIYFKHNLKKEDFLKQYPNTKLTLDSVKEKTSKTCKESGCGKWMKGYEYPEWRIKKYQEKNAGDGNPFFGKKHSKKTRKRMSDNHADVTGNKNPLVRWLEKDPKNREIYSKRMKEVWKDPKNYETVCKRNLENVKQSMLNGNHNPYSNCECGWFESIKFSNKFYYQSSYEKMFLEFCESSNKIKALQRLSFVIPYKDNSGKQRNYYPDFLVNQTNVIEIKPKSMLNYNHNKQKIAAGKKYCDKNGYEYKLLMEDELKNLDKIL
jgi:hypothetical protein